MEEKMQSNPLVEEKKKALEEMENNVKEKSEKTEKAKRRGRPKKMEKEKEKEISQEKIKQEISGICDMLVEMTNAELVKRGLLPINPVQSMMLKTGLVGCALKYNISLDEYPEFLLIGSCAWIGYDKYVEIRQKRGEKEDKANDTSDTRKARERKVNSK